MCHYTEQKQMNKVKILLLIISVLGINLFLVNMVSAGGSLTPEEEVIWSQNNITFYEPCTTIDGDTSEICGENKNYAGEQVFTDEQMKAIKANQPFYEKAASKYGFPWELIAVIHKREHGLARSNPSNGQGVYQFASASRRKACKGGNFSPGKISDEQFQIQTDCAADAIKNSYGAGLDLNTDDGIKKMFFSYNGRAQAYIDQALKLGFSQQEAENGEGSPYVMNRFDAKREPSSTWGQIKRDYGSIEYPANKDFGAFVYYKAIACEGNGEASNDSEDDDTGADDDSSDAPSLPNNASLDNGTNAQRIADTALKLAYSYANKSNASNSNPTDAFIEATKELGSWEKNESHGPDCGFFVKAVLSTAVPNAVDDTSKAPIDSMRKALVSGKETKYSKYWEVIDFKDGDISKLKSGDVVWWQKSSNSQHYYIVAEQGGSLYKVEASYTKKLWGRVSTKLKKKGSVGKKDKQYIFRLANDDNASPPCNSCSQGSMNINGTGACLAWPLGTKESQYTLQGGKVLESALSSPGQTDFSGTGSGNPTFQKAWIATNMYKNSKTNDLNDGTIYSWRYGAYCCGFTATVVRYSGYDPHFSGSLSVGKYEQVNYARNHPDLWEVIEWNREKSQLQGGDVLVSSTHSWMVVEDESGELWRSEASLSAHTFGHIEKYSGSASGTTYIIRATHADNSNSGVSVKGNMSSSSYSGSITNSNGVSTSCNVCDGDEEEGDDSSNGSSGSLKDGGMTLSEAKEFVKPYHDTAMGKYYKEKLAENLTVMFDGALIRSDGCPFGIMNNCVAFSQWFVNKYTTLGPNWNNPSMGYKMVGRLSEFGFSTGTEPQPYAIFSHNSPNHTGVVLGVDKSRKKIIVGEASCSLGRDKLWYEPHAIEVSFSQAKSEGWTYAYPGKKLKLNGLK